MRYPTMWYVRPTKPRSACAYVQSDQSLCLSLEYSMSVKLLTEHHLECLSLTGGCTGSSESTFVKLPHCWKSHVTAHFRNLALIELTFIPPIFCSSFSPENIVCFLYLLHILKGISQQAQGNDSTLIQC